jgi:membrane peptidoglycan carboxypeptidase
MAEAYSTFADGGVHHDPVVITRIEDAQGKGDIIINLGDGYYRPDLSNPVEAAEFRHYINQKRSRIRAQMKTITAMENAANNADTSIDN